jgi:hypothetical protein
LPFKSHATKSKQSTRDHEFFLIAEQNLLALF